MLVYDEQSMYMDHRLLSNDRRIMIGCILLEIGVSQYWGPLKSSYIDKCLLNQPFWGSPTLRNHQIDVTCRTVYILCWQWYAGGWSTAAFLALLMNYVGDNMILHEWWLLMNSAYRSFRVMQLVIAKLCADVSVHQGWAAALGHSWGRY